MNELALPTTVGGLAIMLVVIIAVVGIVVAVIKEMGIQLPRVVVVIGWILVVAFVAIFAIKLLMRM